MTQDDNILALSEEDRLLGFRPRFPILATTNYLISNSLGAVPAEVETSLSEYYQTWSSRGVRAWEEGWWTLVERAGDLVAPLIGAGAGEVVFQPCVTIAHAVVLSALEPRPSRNRVVVDAGHFPSILYLLEGLAQTGFDVVVIPERADTSFDTARFLEAIDDRAAAVCSCHVQFRTAEIVDVASIAARCRETGATCIIDGYQSVGVIPVNVRALGADIYIGGCLKWLCGGPGAAFLWVDPSRCGSLRPRLTGWMAHRRPFGFEPALDPRQDIGRFLHGTPHIAALHAVQPGLRIIAEAGVEAIRTKSIRQTTRLLELIESRGWTSPTPRHAEARGGTVAVTLDHGLEVARALKAQDIACDFRPGVGIRLSPHFYTLDTELESAVSAIDQILKSASWKQHTHGPSPVT